MTSDPAATSDHAADAVDDKASNISHDDGHNNDNGTVAEAVAETVDEVADKVDEVVDDNPWLETVARIGWAAKGVVYTLMGLTAFTLGRQEYTSDPASPQGALVQLMQHTGGRAVLGVVGVGLLLYSLWRLLSALLVRDTNAKGWLTRLGYLFSAVFYVTMGFTALRSAMRGVRPKDSNAIEEISTSMLDNAVLRWVLLVAGIVVVGLGVFFIVKQGIQRDFMKQLNFAGHQREQHLIVPLGTLGWIG
ncbi:MAG TPA: DUF1206 domain-containing protein, partial [Ilumatobacteraceae bacterium]|nr:DUF1206 domain-containing protein [Ilumatobacteraceae bacterium]